MLTQHFYLARRVDRENMDETRCKESKEDLDETEATNKSVEMLDINSTAVVKYTKMGPMETYSTLELNTDIKQPPHNWLHDNLQGRFSNWTSAKHEPVLTSLNMAHAFPENVDEVDIISDAENIKKLLKMPFSKNSVSLSVNKVGRTLLLDEFDVQEVLSQAAQKETLKSLTWLQDVFSEEANMEKDRTSLRKKKDPSQSRERNMMSKFLCYSTPEGTFGSVEQDNTSSLSDHSEEMLHETSESPIAAKEPSSPCKALVPFLPDPVLKPQEKSPFQRNVLWKFEDTKMLIGSNMPIFGGGKYPAVSLRLKDCSKPINVLTGLDYWLDNLMCNVPEVVMCFHLDGIVQKYEHYKTDELPHIEGSQFSPAVIKDVARNILSFLQSNCTLEGHTYWLFKGNGSDVVKLYDLTSLCDKTADSESTNPFSVPVAMLLYRVAKNMVKQIKVTQRERDMIQVLLTNCLHLLNNEQHPDHHLEIITSAHYLLAEVSSLEEDNTEGELMENVTNKSNETTPDSDPDEEFSWPKTLAISDLSKSNSFEETYEKVSDDIPRDMNEKLHLSISHVVKALRNLRGAWGDRNFSNPGNESKRNDLLPSRPYLLALPDIGFTEKSGGDISLTTEEMARDEVSPLNFNFRQWKGTFESVLIRKAASLYSELSSLAHQNGALGAALRYSRFSLGCLASYRNMEWVNAYQELDLLPTVLCGCGDIHLSMTRSRDLEKCVKECEKDYGQINEDDKFLNDNYGSTDDAVCYLDIEFTPDVEKLLMKSVRLYERALDVSTDEHQVEQLVTITKRLGNVRNEVGLFYMNTAVEKNADSQEMLDELRNLWTKSLDSFNGAIRAFQAVDDRPNIALVYSNCGRLMRTCTLALYGGCAIRGTFDCQEKAYYTRAVEYYQKSLRALAERKLFPEIWDRVSWELSGTYFAMGSMVQDFTSSKDAETEECEREISDLMFKALKLCEGLQFSNQESKDEVKTRIGMIHYRLGSLYHHSYRLTSTTDQSAKKKKHLAELHYSKAADYISVASFPCEWLRMNLERVALLEYQLSSARVKGPGTLKILDTMLEYLLNSQQVFEAMNTAKEDNIMAQKGDMETRERTKPVSADKSRPEGNGGKESAKRLAEVDATSSTYSPLQSFSGNSFAEKKKKNSVNVLSFDEATKISTASKEQQKSREFLSLISIFESRLKNSLKEFLKICSSTKRLSSSQKHTETVLKQMFEVVLRGGVMTTPETHVKERCEKILSIISTLRKLHYA